MNNVSISGKYLDKGSHTLKMWTVGGLTYAKFIPKRVSFIEVVNYEQVSNEELNVPSFMSL